MGNSLEEFPINKKAQQLNWKLHFIGAETAIFIEKGNHLMIGKVTPLVLKNVIFFLETNIIRKEIMRTALRSNGISINILPNIIMIRNYHITGK